MYNCNWQATKNKSALYLDTSYYVSQSSHGSTGIVEGAFVKASWKFENFEVGLPEGENDIHL